MISELLGLRIFIGLVFQEFRTDGVFFLIDCSGC